MNKVALVNIKFKNKVLMLKSARQPVDFIIQVAAAIVEHASYRIDVHDVQTKKVSIPVQCWLHSTASYQTSSYMYFLLISF